MARNSWVITGMFGVALVAALVRQNRTRARHPDPAAAVALAGAPRSDAGSNLAHARRTFRTSLARSSSDRTPLPTPPSNLFVRTDYRSAPGLVLPAFVTPDPQDGLRHAAIIWLTGGDTNSLDDFWTPGNEANDQSAHVFRDAGMVMMFPTLRGGNDNASMREYFYGEVDDVLAAAEHLARLPYVDTTRIYLGGHSTGGTLALLTAETSGRFTSVFAFGPVARSDRYGASQIPVYFGSPGDREVRLRSPILWLSDISSPTYVIEGRNAPGNASDVEELCRASGNPNLHCLLASGYDHFSVLDRVTRLIVTRLAMPDTTGLLLRPEDFPAVPVGVSP